MFFDKSYDLWRILIIGVLAYASLVALLRFTGKRTLAKMNAFDLVVTVALGSTLATVLLSADVSLAEGVLAFAVLIALQYAVAWTAVRSNPAQKVVKSNPRALLIDGQLDRDALVRERVTREEVLAAVRSSGLGDLSDVAAVVLETDGSLSVIPFEKAGSRSALETVAGARPSRAPGAAPRASA